MATTVNIHDGKTHLSRLIERAANGEEIAIAKAGKPKVRLVTVAPDTPRRPGRFSVSEDFFEPMPEEELDAWEGKGK